MHRMLPIFLAFFALSTTPRAASAQPADLFLEAVTNVETPTAIRHANDGSNRLFVTERRGVIRVHDLDTETTLATPFLDIDALVDSNGGEQGLLGLAFHPNYSTNGRFFVSYTRDPGPGLDRSVIAEYAVSAGDPNVANPASAVTILEVEQDFSNHNGGDIHFGPDGYLYFGLGDGGSAEDPNDRAQNPQSLLGKMLRLDVDSVSRGAPGVDLARGAGSTTCGLVTNYSIPPDNPCVAGTGFCASVDGCLETWSMGLRNPWRFSFDRATGDLWIGDVGQDVREEIDFQPAASTGGENYGWSCEEGSNTVNFNPCLAGTPTTGPALEYVHSGPSFCSGSVTGGFRYRGSMPSLQGLYVYADFCTGDVYFAEETMAGFMATIWLTTVPDIMTFGEDEAGELYLGRANGAIATFQSVERAFFADGFESGGTARWSIATP